MFSKIRRAGLKKVVIVVGGGGGGGGGGGEGGHVRLLRNGCDWLVFVFPFSKQQISCNRENKTKQNCRFSCTRKQNHFDVVMSLWLLRPAAGPQFCAAESLVEASLAVG